MISTHILDTHLGQPAAGVKIRLFNQQQQLLAEAETNTDGRVTAADFALADCPEGSYSLEFYTAAYFEQKGLDSFFPKVLIYFQIKEATQHYHIPLLISPFAYSTYRGS